MGKSIWTNIEYFTISYFQVFDALDQDLAQSNAGDAMRPNHDTPNDKELEKMHSFSQEIPDKKDFEKAHNPPMLPPHLLQVRLFLFIDFQISGL